MEKELIKFEIKYPEVVWYGDSFVECRKEIIRFDSFKAKVNSNEITGHHRPHVHIEYENINYVCSIDQIIEIIEPKRVPKGIASYITKVVSKNLSKIREEWNNIKSNYKFPKNLIDFNKCTYSYKDSKVYVTIDSGYLFNKN